MIIVENSKKNRTYITYFIGASLLIMMVILVFVFLPYSYLEIQSL